MIGDFIAGAVAGLAVAMPIGAAGTYLIGLGARERMTVASAAALGVASVDGGYAVIAALSGSGVRALLSTLSDW
ncbi:MAG TPA: lysine transporter LysE, partial [Propionibacteriaceae bacterium]|nr:lysine transporter LysE [Propionibacteriaceae bacterium]